MSAKIRAVAAIVSVVLSIALAALIAVAGYADPWIVVAAGGVCVLALAIGWPQQLMLPHRLGSTRAAMIEGPSREAIELVEVK